ncbi:uncharacterized protein LOC101891382 [Musca domestica]|uniref:Uncharacterized protein LOC101891382 n=1 Tax=Musca domestica TaxID=7370 RepID=A0A9J7IGG8_MUSDO|nr:uncharacterized protein LOC101891382 [Musca domestica]
MKSSTGNRSCCKVKEEQVSNMASWLGAELTRTYYITAGPTGRFKDNNPERTELKKRKMCKFHNRLFVFSLLAFGCCVNLVWSKPVLKQDYNEDSNLNFNQIMALTALLSPQDNYDLHYDQRQKGSENYRVKLDGFFIGIPQEESSSLLLLTDDILESFGEEILSKPEKTKKRKESSLELESYPNSQRPLQIGEQDVPSLVVEIPSYGGQKYGEARTNEDGGEELPRKPSTSKTRSFVSHLLGLLKRGHRN